MLDDRTYSVVGINGYRQDNLTREQAIRLARRMQEQMDRAGWRGKMRVFYRDGSLVEWERDDTP
jgi:hypothetical protein